MTIGGSFKDSGEGHIHLSSSEMKMLESGKPIVKQSCDSSGVFTVTLKMTRPRTRAKRFPNGSLLDSTLKRNNWSS
jgi:hypothetical protein